MWQDWIRAERSTAQHTWVWGDWKSTLSGKSHWSRCKWLINQYNQSKRWSAMQIYAGIISHVMNVSDKLFFLCIFLSSAGLQAELHLLLYWVLPISPISKMPVNICMQWQPIYFPQNEAKRRTSKAGTSYRQNGRTKTHTHTHSHEFKREKGKKKRREWKPFQTVPSH